MSDQRPLDGGIRGAFYALIICLIIYAALFLGGYMAVHEALS